jgi:hypothetical protein
MKKLLFALLMTISLNSIAQTKSSELKTFNVCSQESLDYNPSSDTYVLKGEYRCDNCKIYVNDYYISVYEDGKELFSIKKSEYYKSSEMDYSVFYRNKYSKIFVQIASGGEWIAFGKTNEWKLIYNICR